MRLSFTLLSQLMSSVCWLHSLPLRLIFTAGVKKDDSWQPQRQTSLAPRLRQKADPAAASLQDSDWLSLSHVYIPEPITAMRTSLGQLLPLRSRRVCCRCCCVASVVSDSVRPHRRQPTRLPLPGILQARTLEWVAISFSNA